MSVKSSGSLLFHRKVRRPDLSKDAPFKWAVLCKIWVLILKGTALNDRSALEKRRQKEKEGRWAGLPAPNERVDVHRTDTAKSVQARTGWCSCPNQQRTTQRLNNVQHASQSFIWFWVWTYCNYRATIATFNNHTPQCYNNAYRLIKRGCSVFGKLFVGVGGCLEWPALDQPSVQAVLLTWQKAAAAPDPDLEKAAINQTVDEWGHISGLTQNKGRTTEKDQCKCVKIKAGIGHCKIKITF